MTGVRPAATASVPSTAPALRAPVVAGVLGKVAEALTLVALATVVPRVLGPVDYGRLAVALAVIAIGSVGLTLGGATVLGRYVPAAEPGARVALARAITTRLARNRAAGLAALTGLAGLLVVVDPTRFPPHATALVLAALALNVAATLLLQADLGLGRPAGWCARYPVQNTVLITAVLGLYASSGVTGALTAPVLAAGAGLALAVVAAAPVLRSPARHPPLPVGWGRFAALQAAGGALVQLTQRGGVPAVALLAGGATQTGFAALALGLAAAATYAILQIFTVTLPRLSPTGAGTAVGEAALRRLAGRLLAVVAPAALVAVVLADAVVPVAFGDRYTGAVAAFGPATALVVLAPVNALALQVGALRLRPEATAGAAAAGAAVFAVVAVLAVPATGAVGAAAAALAGTAATTLLAARLLPAGIGAPLCAGSLAGAAAVTTLAALT